MIGVENDQVKKIYQCNCYRFWYLCDTCQFYLIRYFNDNDSANEINENKLHQAKNGEIQPSNKAFKEKYEKIAYESKKKKAYTTHKRELPKKNGHSNFSKKNTYSTPQDGKMKKNYQKTLTKIAGDDSINPEIPKKDIPDGYTREEFISQRVESYKSMVSQMFGGSPLDCMVDSYKRKLEEEYK